MPILFRWMFTQCLGRTLATLAALVAIFAIIEIFDKSRYLGHGMTAPLIAEYIILKVPVIITELMPVIVLIAISIFISEISHHHEVVALKASGLGVKRLLIPVLCVGALVALFSFLVGEYVSPITNTRLDTIERINIHHKPEAASDTQWLKDGNRLFRITPLTDNAFSLIVLETNENRQWVKRIDAQKAVYKNDTWLLSNLHVSQPDKEEGMMLEQLDRTFIASEAGPEKADPPSPRHMNYEDLYYYAKTLKQSGLNAAGYEFEFHRKLSSLLTCLVMVILAVALCLNLGNRIAATSLGLIAALGIGMLFYVLSNASSLLIHGQQLPAWYAAWLPLISFGGLAVFLLLHRESRI